ncbi:hypothetical protein JCM10213_006791 [Rhodosporidiobolus nylandii]
MSCFGSTSTSNSNSDHRRPRPRSQPSPRRLPAPLPDSGRYAHRRKHLEDERNLLHGDWKLCLLQAHWQEKQALQAAVQQKLARIAKIDVYLFLGSSIENRRSRVDETVVPNWERTESGLEHEGTGKGGQRKLADAALITAIERAHQDLNLERHGQYTSLAEALASNGLPVRGVIRRFGRWPLEPEV